MRQSDAVDERSDFHTRQTATRVFRRPRSGPARKAQRSAVRRLLRPSQYQLTVFQH